MKTAILSTTLLAFVLTSAPALADPPRHAPAHGYRHKAEKHHAQQMRKAYRYNRYGQYADPVRLDRGDVIWRSADGQYRCRRDNGTTGLIIGAAVGALVGRQLDGGRRRTVGTVIGAAGGALLGREVDRGSVRCR